MSALLARFDAWLVTHDALFWSGVVWFSIGHLVTRWGLRRDRRQRLIWKRLRCRLHRLRRRYFSRREPRELPLHVVKPSELLGSQLVSRN